MSYSVTIQINQNDLNWKNHPSSSNRQYRQLFIPIPTGPSTQTQWIIKWVHGNRSTNWLNNAAASSFFQQIQNRWPVGPHYGTCKPRFPSILPHTTTATTPLVRRSKFDEYLCMNTFPINYINSSFDGLIRYGGRRGLAKSSDNGLPFWGSEVPCPGWPS